MDAREMKIKAAEAALAHVEDGMRLGIGTGSTAEEFARLLAEKVAGGLRVEGVPTSERTARLCVELGVPLKSLDELPELDLTIDGADEVDSRLRLIKGGGGAHLQEKVVAAASDRMIVISDPGKRVTRLGAFPLPVEVLQFGWQASCRHVETMLADLGYAGVRIAERMAGEKPFVSDEGNFILDLHMGVITDPAALAMALNQIPGLVENGLFIDMSDLVIVGHTDGSTELIEAAPGPILAMQEVRERKDQPFADMT